MSNKRKWSELTERQRRIVAIGGVVETVLTAVALRDLRRRPSSSVRGPKSLWALASFVQPVGPLAYLLFGRRSQ